MNSVKCMNGLGVCKIGIVQRKEREKEEMRAEILNAARAILSTDGVDGVSIRKIAGKIEYSPAIIYHYFKNKEEIIEKLIEQSYREIIESLSACRSLKASPEEKLKECASAYIRFAEKMGDCYLEMMLNHSPAVLARTSVLQRGASKERPAIALLCDMLHELPECSCMDETQMELTVQVIWSTIFGLTLRLTVEHVEEVQKQRLIDRAVDVILHSLKGYGYEI